METREILELVKNGSMSVEEAEGHFRRQPFEDMGYAKLDLHRKVRSGFPEVIFCSGKPDEFLINIFQRMAAKEGQAFGTRATAEQYEMVRKVIPDIQYDPVSRILKLERTPAERKGLIAVVTGGTADIPVAEEAAQTAEYFGSKVERIYDVGVSGIHRLLSQTQKLQEIAVPTSVGYGANFGGLSALLTMINSCANGIAVVNIDNGYGAGYMATQINRLACGGNKSDAKQ